ncbi:MAG: DegT/DnrJ/EryC1/StrS family aminotransferase [Deltaproteobacteria bacterium]|nr:DegT/DnrJ/EryC1/StrS family aminotransferase [Deltaproteobacteria bacterium]MCL4872590.1 DegT/DnrJ/EryC1/StrS family aminotransferase [bacterium]
MNKTTGGATPFVDLASHHVEIEDELVGAFRQALRESSFIGGAAVEDFESRFAGFCGARFSSGVANGTDALKLALVASGVKPGDTVVTVANTFIATVEAISQAGALAAFVDIDEKTYNMDPAALRRYLDTACESTGGRTFDKRTKSPVTAVVPVHLYGQPAEMDAILDIADGFGLTVIEDACQAHGAKYLSRRTGRWMKAGSMGAAAAFSFYPGKNLGACGDAGAVTTNDREIIEYIKMARDHGQSRKYIHEIEGCNSRLDAIQAMILRIKLRRLSEWNEMRREAARVYDRLFRGSEKVITPAEHPDARHVYHLYVIRVRNREAHQRRLSEAGVSTGLHYPVPLHLQRACARFGYLKGDLPVTERVADEILSLPMYPGLRPSDQERIAALILGPEASGIADRLP